MFKNTLSPSKKTARAPCVLENADTGAVLFHFQYNPEAIEYAFTAQHRATEASGQDGQHLEPYARLSRVYRIPDLILDTYQDGLGLQGVLDALHAMSKPTAPDVRLRWAQRVLPRTRVTSVSVSERSWLNGEFAAGRVTIELTENALILPHVAQEPRPPATLTARQVKRITELTRSTITRNSETIPIVGNAENVRRNLRLGQFSVTEPTNASALVTTAQNAVLEFRERAQRELFRHQDAVYELVRKL